MGKDSTGCNFDSGSLGKYDDFHWWPSCMHWLSILACGVSPIHVSDVFPRNINEVPLFIYFRMKALLFTLIRAFEFELSVPANDIGTKSFIVQRPFLKSNPKAGNQMPLILKPVNQA